MATKRGADLSSSWVASGNLSSHQYKFVHYAGVDVYLASSGAYTLAPAGVLQNKPQNNEHAGVIGVGYSKIFLSGSLGPNTEVTPGINGGATSVGSNQWCGGLLVTGGNSGDIGEMLVNIHRKGAY